MSVNTIETKINKIADLASRGYSESAIKVLNKCPLTEAQKEKITTIINQGPASDNLQQATELMKADIVAALNGEEVAPGPGQQANQIVPFHQRTYVPLPTMTSFIWDRVPTEIFQHIAFHIDMNVQTVTTCSLVCKQWLQIFNGDSIWRNLLSANFPHNNTNAKNNFRATFQTIYSNLSTGVCSQKAIQKQTQMIGIFDGNLICRSDERIKIWDLKTCKRIDTLENACIFETPLLCTPDGKLISTNLYGHICIWDLEKDLCINTIPHNSGVKSAIANEGKLFISTYSGEIVMYDMKTSEEALLETDGDIDFACDFLAVADRKLFAASKLGHIKVFDLTYFRCVHNIQPEITFRAANAIQSLDIFDGKLIAFCCPEPSNNRAIKVWNLQNYEEIKCLPQPVESIDTSPVAAHGKLIWGSYNGYNAIKILDLKSYECVETYANSDMRIKQVMASPGRLAIIEKSVGDLFGGIVEEDCKIQVFDFTADHLAIFSEIAKDLEGPNYYKALYAGGLFFRMPQDAQNAIFGKLYEIIKSQLENDYWGCAEHAFDGQIWQFGTHEQKAQAIKNYLAEQRSNGKQENTNNS